MVNTSGGPEHKVEVNANIGGLHFGSYIAIVALIHVVYGIGLRIGFGDAKEEKQI